MISNINTFWWSTLVSMLLAHVSEAAVIPELGGFENLNRRDVSHVVKRSLIAQKQNATTSGLVQRIWLSDDGLRYYTNISFGTPLQPLTLALSLGGTTWVPTLPAGVDARSYCADAINDVACSYATISGFYTVPGSVTYSPQGDFEELSVNEEDTINGIQAIENIKLGDVVLESVGIAVANDWASSPQLSLASQHDSGNLGQQLLPILREAGVINTLTYSLAFISVDESGDMNYASGELSFGGIDGSQFFGELNSFESGNATYAGVLPISNIYWIDGKGKNVSVAAGDDGAGHLGVGHISLNPYLWVPDAMFEIILNLFANLEKPQESQLYSRDCASAFGDLNVRSIQISIDRTLITIPVKLLFLPGRTVDRKKICNLAIQPISKYQIATKFDYILGFPFLQSAYTVFDQTHRQIHLAPRRVAFLTTPSFTPVGQRNATVSGAGVPLRTTFNSAMTTMSSPLNQISTTKLATSITTAPPSTTTKTQYYYEAPKSKANIGAIVGGVVSAVVVLAMMIVIYPLLRTTSERRRHEQRHQFRTRGRPCASSINDLSSVSNNQKGGEDNGNDEDYDEKEVDAITTAIAISESKKGNSDSREGGRSGETGERDSVTVDNTEVDEESSAGNRGSGEVTSVNTFGEGDNRNETMLHEIPFP